MTPLQVGVSESTSVVVSLLLAAGAQPDAVADKPLKELDVYPGPWLGRAGWAGSEVRFKEFKIFGDRKPLDICRCIRRKRRSGVIHERGMHPKVKRVRIWNCEVMLSSRSLVPDRATPLSEYGATASDSEDAYDLWPICYQFVEGPKQVKLIEDACRKGL